MGNAVCCLRIAIGLVVALSLAACTGGSSDSSAAASAAQYTVGGTVSGLSGSGLTLQSNSGETLAIAADGSFTFHTTLTSGSAYYIIAASQPSNPIQRCAVGHSTGTIGGGNVTDISVLCTNKTDMTADAIGITLVGVRGSGLVLQNNGGDNLTAASDGTLTFALGIPTGTPYEISVLSPPIEPYEDCVVVNGSGTASGSDVGNVVVSCTVNTNPKHSISGTIVGVSGSIVLQDNGRDDLTITADGSFVFPLQIPQGSVYDVATKSAAGAQSQTCQFQNARGVVGNHDVTGIVLTCNANISLKVATSGLSGTGLVLQNNGRDNLPVSANGTTGFPTGLIPGDAYAVTVATQPTNPSQTCVVTNGTGTAAPGVTATVTCTTNQFAVGGTVTGLPDPTQGANINLVLQDNLGDDFTIPVNSQSPTAFQFPIKIASGAGYSVTVKTQPGADTQFGPPGVIQTTTVCLVSAGTGIVANGDVASIVVNCVRPSGFAYVTNGSDNTITPYVVDSGTGLLLPSGAAAPTGTAPSASATSNTTASLYVSNTGSGNLSVYDMDPNTGVLKTAAGSPVSVGLTAPTSVALQSPSNGLTLYVTDAAASGSVSALRVGATPAALTLVNTLPTGAGPTSGFFYVGGAPTFHTYYAVSNSAADSLSLFRLDDTTGALTAVQNGFLTGKTPRSIGHYSGTNPASGLPFETLYVANTGDGTITTLSFNTATEVLSQQGTALTVGPGLNSLVQAATGVYATASQGVFVYSYLADGSLLPAQGNPFAAGNGPTAAAGFQGNLYVVNQADETISVFFLATGGTAVPITPKVPIKTGHGPTSIVVVQRPQFGGG